MPPNTHYLDWLNPLNADQYAQPLETSAEDISKSLELFTNSNFLDTEALFNTSSFDAAAYEAQPGEQEMISQPLSNVHTPRALSMTAPRLQQSQYRPIQARPSADLASLAFMSQLDSHYSSPATQKRTAEEADLYGATPGSDFTSEDNKTNKVMNEEDKRRRNTAASARFRVKKKEREKALQQSAKSTLDKNQQLEQRIKELEMENKWLRSLLKPVNAEQSKSVLASL